uniref:Zinc finger PHD-type domain-containing protein n=1 Tax=Physcomitrium patens TaxID=3218 RepID=A0A2K1JKS5_PHYPA|nr:hypothetical protein PHYPA_016983 [Physcomitrium patens]
MPYNPDGLMVQCEICKDWFHPSCMRFTPNQVKKMEKFVCPDCTSQPGGKKVEQSSPRRTPLPDHVKFMDRELQRNIYQQKQGTSLSLQMLNSTLLKVQQPLQSPCNKPYYPLQQPDCNDICNNVRNTSTRSRFVAKKALNLDFTILCSPGIGTNPSTRAAPTAPLMVGPEVPSYKCFRKYSTSLPVS